MTATQEQQASAESRARGKDEARDSRFHFRNFAEHSLRRELKEEALEICDPQVKAFAECAQDNGLWVIFKCTAQHDAVKQCLAIHNSEDAWQRYKEKHAEELEQRAKLQGPPRPPPKVPRPSH